VQMIRHFIRAFINWSWMLQRRYTSLTRTGQSRLIQHIKPLCAWFVIVSSWHVLQRFLVWVQQK
jgi:hypothetical protein